MVVEPAVYGVRHRPRIVQRTAAATLNLYRQLGNRHRLAFHQNLYGDGCGPQA